MITLEEACRIAYKDRLMGTKYKCIKDAGDSYIICYVASDGTLFTTNPYRISKEDGRRLPFVLPDKEYFDMFFKAKDVEVPKEYALMR